MLIAMARTTKAFAVAAIFIVLFILHQVYREDFSYDIIHNLTTVGDKQKVTVVTVTSTVFFQQSITTTVQIQAKPSPKPLPTQFPKKVWHKCSKPISQDDRDKADTWLEKNPDFRHEILTDESGDAYVKDRFRDRPDILEVYLNLTVPILKADVSGTGLYVLHQVIESSAEKTWRRNVNIWLTSTYCGFNFARPPNGRLQLTKYPSQLLRYLILLADGGIWSDLDVSCLEKVDDWIPDDWKARAGVVVGLEFDSSFPGEGQRPASQFASWTVMAKPGLKHMEMVVNDIVKELGDIAKDKNKTYSELKKSDLSDVVDVTGPKKMTLSLLKSLSAEMGGLVDDRNVSMFKRPVIVGDLVVLPQAAFAAMQGGFPTDQGKSFVSHHYAGSWKGDER